MREVNMKRSPIRRQSKSPVSVIKRRIQKLLTQICRKRDGRCIFEGKTDWNCGGKYTAADHIISRRYSVTYADPRNTVLICPAHHLLWKPANPTLYADIVKERIGKELYDELHRLRKESTQHPKTYTRTQWLEHEEELKRRLKEV